jgi:hypothetical protein
LPPVHTATIVDATPLYHGVYASDFWRGMSLWENCEPTNEQLSDLTEIENIIKLSFLTSSQVDVIPSSQTQHLHLLTNSNSYEKYHSKFVTLVEVENKCSSFLVKLDEILMILDDISLSHEEITSRTNVLMMNCESLLEQQVTHHISLHSFLCFPHFFRSIH